VGDAGRRTTTSNRGDKAAGTTVTWRTAMVAVLLAVVAAVRSGGTVADASTPSPAAPLYGVTIDRIAGIDSVVAAERSLPERPTTRIYFDVSEPASYYARTVPLLHTVSRVMGELLDSSDAAGISTSAFQSRVESYLHALGSSVDLWEVGNEVNGNWTGPYASGAAKVTEAYGDVVDTGGETALTLYANEYGPDHCGDGTAELTPVQYSERFVPKTVRDGLTDVFESYYPTQCGNTYPTDAQVATEMRRLHSLYPDAHLGFGEVGLPHPVTRRTLATGESVMSWAYGLDPGLSYYVGGYFWWYASEDAFTGRALMAGSLRSAFEAEATALR
jgi:hypothetical protein